LSIKAILAATILLFVSSPALPGPAIDDEAPDLVIINAKVHTVDKDNPEAEAVAVRDGKFIAVGSNRKIRRIATRKTRLIDAEGRLIVPGFNDSHAHLLGIGNLFTSIDLRNVTTPKQLSDAVAEFTRFLPKGVWILGGRWDAARWQGGGLPSKEMIDAVSRDNPVLVYNSDATIALANSKALEIAGIDRNRAGINGGEIVKAGDGEPTGILKGEAITLVKIFTSRDQFEERLEKIETAANYAVAHGITSLQDMSTDDNMDALEKLVETGRLKARVYECTALKDWKMYADRGIKHATGTPMLRTGCLKSFTDGNPETLPELYDRISGADKAGLQVMIHAIGNRATHYVLGLYEKAIRENGYGDRRFRVEHSQGLLADDIPEFARFGIIPSMQPYLFRGTGPYRSLLDSQALIAFGSDSSITDIDPLLGISVATVKEPSKTSEKLTVEEAVRLYTLGAAYAEFQEDVKGSIRVGKVADLVILSDNIFKMEPAKIRDTKVLLTIMGGKVVYRSSDFR
jgi:predicted amidohydrolase YtcJ